MVEQRFTLDYLCIAKLGIIEDTTVRCHRRQRSIFRQRDKEGEIESIYTTLLRTKSQSFLQVIFHIYLLEKE